MAETCTEAGQKRNAQNYIDQEAGGRKEEGQASEKVVQQRPRRSSKNGDYGLERWGNGQKIVEDALVKL